MQIVRASMIHFADADSLLQEYFEAVGVVKRDSPEEIRGYLEGASSALWLAYLDGLPAGCVALRPAPHAPNAVECKRLYVCPRFRGHGIAAALLDALEQEARSSAMQWIYLDSTEDFKAALRLYEARGYTACERYNDNPQATIFLRKHLLTRTGR